MMALLLLIACAHSAAGLVSIREADRDRGSAAERRAEEDREDTSTTKPYTFSWEPPLPPGLLDVAETDPGSLVAERDACTGCDFTVDLRCIETRFGRHGSYHRIADCLVPVYGMIRLARTAHINNASTNVCAITWSRTDGMDLSFFLSQMVNIKWHSLVDELDSCARDLPYHGLYRTFKQGAKEQWIHDFANNKQRVHAYSLDVKRNLQWLQADIQGFVGTRPPLFILIQRDSHSRQFRYEDLQKLKNGAAEIQLQGKDLPQFIYSGSESFATTVEMFSSAAVVVGYHGGGFANTLFSGNRNCQHEISTTEDLDGKKQWRRSQLIGLQVNAQARHDIFNISLAGLLKDNDVDVARFAQADDKDLFIKNLQFVHLSDNDVRNLYSDVRQCLDAWVEGHWANW